MFARLLPAPVVFTLVLFASSAYAATAPGFTIKASNVSLDGQSSGTTTVTLTSVSGFTGSVGIVCTGPNGNLLPDLVMPQCAQPTLHLTVPANGSVQGTLKFYPPWKNDEEALRREPGTRPVLACTLGGAALLGLGLRRRRGRTALFACALGILMLSGAVGCLGNGGLQMTPGTYTYTLSGASNSAIATGSVKVTVHCSACS